MKLFLMLLLVSLVIIGCEKNETISDKVVDKAEMAVLERSIDLSSAIINTDSSTINIGRISCIDIDSDGNIFLSDLSNSVIYKYDNKTEKLMHIGRRGHGPGEFGNQLYSFEIASDTIYVPNYPGKISKFDCEGNYCCDISFGERALPASISKINNGFVGYNYKLQFNGEKIWQNVSRSLFESDFAEVKEIYSSEKSTAMGSSFNPIEGNVVFAVSEDFLAVSKNNSQSFDIEVFDSKGELAYRLQKNVIRAKHSDAEIKQMNNNYNFFYDNKKIKIKADYKNTVSQLGFDSKGNLWINTGYDEEKKEFDFDIYKGSELLRNYTLKAEKEAQLFFKKEKLFVLGSDNDLSVYGI